MKRLFACVGLMTFVFIACGEGPTWKPAKIKPLDKPYIGAPIAVFAHRYSLASHNMFYDRKDTDTSIAVQTDNMNKVVYISIITADKWTIDATKRYCSQFLPKKSTVLGSHGDAILYTSSVGKFSVQVVSEGACVLSRPSSGNGIVV